MNNYPAPPLPEWGKDDRQLIKQRHQVKSRFYYIFWGLATVSVFAGQIYVGSGYRQMSKAFNRIMNDLIQIIKFLDDDQLNIINNYVDTLTFEPNQVFSANEGDGYDFMDNTVKELSSCGIIDPVKVTRCALENAVSVASTLLTTNYAVVSQ